MAVTAGGGGFDRRVTGDDDDGVVPAAELDVAQAALAQAKFVGAEVDALPVVARDFDVWHAGDVF